MAIIHLFADVASRIPVLIRGVDRNPASGGPRAAWKPPYFTPTDVKKMNNLEKLSKARGLFLNFMEGRKKK